MGWVLRQRPTGNGHRLRELSPLQLDLRHPRVRFAVQRIEKQEHQILRVRFVEATPLHEQAGNSRARDHGVRVDRKRGPERPDRLVQPQLLQMNLGNAQMEPAHRHERIALERVAKRRDRLPVTRDALVKAPEVLMRHTRPRVCRDRRVDLRLDRFVRLDRQERRLT